MLLVKNIYNSTAPCFLFSQNRGLTDNAFNATTNIVGVAMSKLPKEDAAISPDQPLNETNKAEEIKTDKFNVTMSSFGSERR